MELHDTGLRRSARSVVRTALEELIVLHGQSRATIAAGVFREYK